ncbi:MAG: FtsX-like permease family protein [Acidimicrobiia bacterium]
MAVLWLRLRSEWRLRWPSLVALTFLVALVGGVVLTAVSGARRARSSVDRFATATRSTDGFIVFSTSDGAAPRRVAGLREVSVASRLATVTFFSKKTYLATVATVDGRLGDTIERDRVVRGRRAEQSAPREVTLSEPAARKLGLDVGDKLTLTGISQEQGQCAFGNDPSAANDPTCAAVQQNFFSQQPDFTKFAGPTVALEVVGVTRGLDDVVKRPRDLPLVVLTQGFFQRYGRRSFTRDAVAVRFRPGVTPPEFEDAVARVVPPTAISDVSGSAPTVDGLRSTVGVLANGLLVFAGVAALAGLVALAQALARQTAGGGHERSVLRSLGATARERRLDAVAPLLPVAAVGALLAGAGAWITSPLMPIGTARRLEPHPGWSFDGPVLVGGCLAVATITVAATLLSARWVERRSARSTRERRARDLVVGGVVPTIGLRFARDTGHGPRTVPVRSAVAGIATGVAGLVAVGTFAAGQSRLAAEPARFGWPWDATIGADGTGECNAKIEKVAARLGRDADVERVTPICWGYQARVAGRSVTTFAQPPGVADGGFVIVRGRSPATPDEIALGAKTMRREHVGIGGTVDVEGQRARVVGQAIFPVSDDGYPLADGVLLSFDGFRARHLQGPTNESGNRQFAIRLRDGADHNTAIARLQKLTGDGDPPVLARTPPEVDQLQQLDRLPLVLAGFLLIVALVAATHALVLTMRRRIRELALLRAVGFTAGQTKAAVAWQASALSLAGIVIGVPIGVLLGRLVWARVADAFGLATDPAWPWIVLALVVPVTLVVVNLVAWPLARRAARVRPARILRTE